MNRYWLRIALGALLVFVLGVTAMAAVKKGKEGVQHLLGTAATRIPLQLANLKFRFEGRTIGDIQGIDVQRSGPEDAGRISVRVHLTADDAIELVRGCTLTLDDPAHLSSRTGFRCADQAELDAGDLVQSGEVRFEPGDVSRPLLLLRRDVERWRRSDIRSLEATMATDAKGGVKARGSFDVRSHGRPERGSFTLQADSQGAVISVRDDAGRALLDFRADRHGVNLNVRDKQGRNLLKLLADSLGTALRVHQR